MLDLKISKILSSTIAKRRFFVQPPVPPASFLISDPSSSIYFGKTKDLNIPFYWDFEKLINPHIVVVGISGSGKSYFVKTFLTRAFLSQRANAIIIDWIGEYNEWVKFAGGKVITLGDKGSINILDAHNMKPIDRAKQIVSSFEILTDSSDFTTKEYFLEKAILECYQDFGFDISKKVKSKRKAMPTLKDVEKKLSEYALKEQGKTREQIESIKYIVARYTKPGADYFSRKSTINIDHLINNGLICIDLHEIPSDEIRSMAGLSILQFIKERMRLSGWKSRKGVKLYVVIDEAWKISSDERSDVITIIREGRKYQFGLIVASQNPTDMHKAIFSNAGTIVVMRLVLDEFKKYVQESLNYSSYFANEIEKFGVGNAMIHLEYAFRTNFSKNIVLSKIDGEEPLVYYKLMVLDMKIEMEKQMFLRNLVKLGLDANQMEEIKATFEKNDYICDVFLIVSLLEKFGYSKTSIIMFLRELGVDDKNLIGIFSKLERKRMGVEDSLYKIRIEDEDYETQGNKD